MKLPPEEERKLLEAVAAQGQQPRSVRLPSPPAKKSGKAKYKNSRIDTPDGKFDSKREYKRWLRLKEMFQAGTIQFLRRQVRYPLTVNGVRVCVYVSDFTYLKNGKMVVEDSKSPYTAKLPLFRIKKRLMAALHGIDVKEVF